MGRDKDPKNELHGHDNSGPEGVEEEAVEKKPEPVKPTTKADMFIHNSSNSPRIVDVGKDRQVRIPPGHRIEVVSSLVNKKKLDAQKGINYGNL